MMQHVAWSLFLSKLGALDQLGEQRIDNFHLSLLGAADGMLHLLGWPFFLAADLTDWEWLHVGCFSWPDCLACCNGRAAVGLGGKEGRGAVHFLRMGFLPIITTGWRTTLTDQTCLYQRRSNASKQQNWFSNLIVLSNPTTQAMNDTLTTRLKLRSNHIPTD